MAIQNHNIGIDIDELVSDLPAGLDRAVLRVLSFHVGRTAAIGRFDFVAAVKQHGITADERQLRACINQLRKSGFPICSTGGKGGGYWMAANWSELEDYIQAEMLARIKDINDQVTALRASAVKSWGKYSPQKQGMLF